MSLGFIKLPREFLESDDWQSLNPINRTVFLILLEQATFENREFNNLGEVIELEPGDICISRSRLLKLCPKGITDKKLRLSILSLNRSQLVQKRAKKRAKEKMVLSISNPIICRECFSKKGQEKGQEKGQRRAKEGPIKKEGKELKEEKEKVKKENSEKSKEVEKTKEQTIFVREFVHLTPAYIEELKEMHLPAKLEWLFNRLDSWMTTKEGPFTAKWCYGQLKPGGWPCLEYEKMKKDEAKTTTF